MDQNDESKWLGGKAMDAIINQFDGFRAVSVSCGASKEGGGGGVEGKLSNANEKCLVGVKVLLQHPQCDAPD